MTKEYTMTESATSLSGKTYPWRLTEEEKEEKAAKLDEAIARHAEIPGALIAVLQEAQRIYGWLPLEVLQAVADGMRVPISQAAGVGTYKPYFNNEPYGECVIRICTSAPCHVVGAEETLAALEAELGIRLGGTTPDGKFSLLPCDCLGACDRSPAVLVGETLYGPVKAEDVPAFVRKLKGGDE